MKEKNEKILIKILSSLFGLALITFILFWIMKGLGFEIMVIIGIAWIIMLEK